MVRVSDNAPGWKKLNAFHQLTTPQKEYTIITSLNDDKNYQIIVTSVPRKDLLSMIDSGWNFRCIHSGGWNPLAGALESSFENWGASTLSLPQISSLYIKKTISYSGFNSEFRILVQNFRIFICKQVVLIKWAELNVFTPFKDIFQL